MPYFKFEIKQYENCDLIILKGTLTWLNCSDFLHEVDVLMQYNKTLILDFKNLEKIDSVSICIIMNAIRSLQKNNINLYVMNAGEKLLYAFKLLELTGYIKYIENNSINISFNVKSLCIPAVY